MATPRGNPVLRVLQGWTAFFLLLAAQFAVRPFFDGRVSVEFLLIGLLLAVLRMRSGTAAVAGLLVGLLLDARVADTFGCGVLALTVVAYGASRVRALFFTDHVGLTATFVGLGSWSFLTLRHLLVAVMSPTGSGNLAGDVLVWAPLTSTCTAVVSIGLLVLFRPLFRPAA